MVIFCPSCAPNMAPTTGPVCCRSVWRIIQSDIVRSTSGWRCTVGELSDARVADMSGFCEASAMIRAVFDDDGYLMESCMIRE